MEAQEVVVPTDPKEKVEYWAKEYGVDLELAHYIAYHESKYDPNAMGDMHIVCPRNGKPTRARGIYQITSCWHPNVTDDQAFDPDFNIQYAMKLISQGKTTCMKQFTTCRVYYQNI